MYKPAFPFVGRSQHKLLSLPLFCTASPYLRQLFPLQKALQLCCIIQHYLQVHGGSKNITMAISMESPAKNAIDITLVLLYFISHPTPFSALH